MRLMQGCLKGLLVLALERRGDLTGRGGAGWSSSQERGHSILVGDHATPLAPIGRVGKAALCLGQHCWAG